MFIIYRKTDGKPMLQETLSSIHDKETYTFETELNHVVKHHRGSIEDYDVAWVDDNEVTQKTYTHEFKVLKGEIVFGAEKIIEEPPIEPSPLEKLAQDNILLKAQNQALIERADFHEELIAELAMIVYP
ncbi:hypothetical protein [Bacillus sp. JJ1474]|uniref:hypothetical protein n=1 Tax=Bacillus sp. JJ1474 TaxID=3122955 RepID=UPI0030005399